MMFLASFGDVMVVSPGPALPAENTSVIGWLPSVSKSPSRTSTSWVRALAM
jgi:hypothetical protein